MVLGKVCVYSGCIDIHGICWCGIYVFLFLFVSLSGSLFHS
jgi:hypothetical protein